MPKYFQISTIAETQNKSQSTLSHSIQKLDSWANDTFYTHRKYNLYQKFEP